MRIHNPCVLTSLRFLITCTPHPTPQSPFNPAHIEAEVRAMLAEYAEAQRQNGVLGELPFLDTTDAFFAAAGLEPGAQWQ